MDTSRELAAPLTNLLYAVAEEDADDWATGPGGDIWAGLLRDGADIARRLREQIEANAAPARDEIDAEDWAVLGAAFGVIVRRDHRRNAVSARAFTDEEELLAEWEATKAELEPSGGAVEAAEMGDSTEGPSSGPMPPRDDPDDQT
ncbi:MAG TPA: hypothetical protein VGZ23_03440 [bacterium]|nr:hypothetical protein [bacterium]